uniref:G-protein coupled receptors family 1 profile domain-containing protein n=1 Tax=Nothobranchius furzeri TaxID=105023 RepID=A0A8C6KGY3_NOTFU
MLSEMNNSKVTEFILTGFPGLQPEYYGLVSTVLFLVYFVALLANITVFYLFGTNRCLHKQMYFIILNLIMIWGFCSWSGQGSAAGCAPRMTRLFHLP